MKADSDVAGSQTSREHQGSALCLVADADPLCMFTAGLSSHCCRTFTLRTERTIMRSTCWISLLVLAYVSADLSEVLKTCKDVSCEEDSNDDDDTVEMANDASGKRLTWVTGGLPHIFWQAVTTGSFFNQSSTLTECEQELVMISEGMQRNEEWAYHFPDSSGKASPGLLRSTITSMGDYDQCLDIHHASKGITGMYCMIDLFHVKMRVGKGKLALHQVSLPEDHPHMASLCLPSACRLQQVQQMIRILLKPYLIRVKGVVHCDTGTSISWSSRLSNLTRMQIASLILLSTIVIAVFSCTGIHAYKRFSLPNDNKSDNLIHSLSMVTSAGKLFYSKPWTFESLVFDSLKTNIIVLGTVAHIMTCAESPLALATIAQLRAWHKVNMPLLQNDSGLLGIPFLTGIATFTVLYPLAKGRRLPYSYAIFDRVSRFLPPLIVLTACEFIWPILGSGPFYSRVTVFNLAKCQRNWLYNLMFVNNALNAIDICSGHAFWSSVDMQLFILGLIALFLFNRSDKVGLGFSLLMIVIGTVKTAYNASVNDTGFSLYDVKTVPHRIVEYFNYIHMPTSSYLAPYFTGFIVAFFRSCGLLSPKLSTHRQTIAFALMTWLAFVTVNFNCSIVTWYLDSYKWFFITFNRTFQLIGNVMLFLFWMSWKDYWEEGWGRKFRDQGVTFSPFKALCRLCFPLYICNYLYVRMEFFTRRFLVSGGGFWIFKRTLSSIIIVYLFAIVFHLLILAPLDALRESLLTKSSRTVDQKEE